MRLMGLFQVVTVQLYITVTEPSLPPLDVSGYTQLRSPCGFCDGRTQYHPLSAAIAKNRMGNASVCTGRRLLHAPTAIGGIADGVHRSTADTLERG